MAHPDVVVQASARFEFFDDLVAAKDRRDLPVVSVGGFHLLLPFLKAAAATSRVPAAFRKKMPSVLSRCKARSHAAPCDSHCRAYPKALPGAAALFGARVTMTRDCRAKKKPRTIGPRLARVAASKRMASNLPVFVRHGVEGELRIEVGRIVGAEDVEYRHGRHVVGRVLPVVGQHPRVQHPGGVIRPK